MGLGAGSAGVVFNGLGEAKIMAPNIKCRQYIVYLIKETALSHAICESYYGVLGIKQLN
jgi:hypothetical protein